MSKADTVIDRAMQFVNEKQPYCFGGKNQPMNKKNKSRVKRWQEEHSDKSNYGHILGNDKTKAGKNYKQYINADSSPYVLIDCSGLTRTSFKAAGFDINEGSCSQHDKGESYAKRGKATYIDPQKHPKDVKPGTLLWRQGHVALVGHNRKVIEAKGWRYGCVAGMSNVSDFTAAYVFNTISGDTDGGTTQPSQPSHGSDTPTTPGAGTVKITAHDLNVRTDSNTDAKKIGQLHKNDVVEYTGMKDGWYKIKYEGQTGYICGKYAKVVTKASDSGSDSGHSNSHSGSAGSVKVTAHNLNVRTDSNTDATKIGQLHKNDVVGYSGMKNGWYQIDYKGGVGYIYGEYAKVI